MDSNFMNAMAQLIAGHDVRVLRFEFPYMAERRVTGKRRPPPRAETLMDYFAGIIGEAPAPPGAALFIGGKSMGGRIASLVAQAEHDAGRVAGLICLGYPFHPPGKPDRLRTDHLIGSTVPALICQGERDPFGTKEEVPGYGLPAATRVHWAPDGNHDLSPRKASGRTAEDNWTDCAATIGGFIGSVV